MKKRKSPIALISALIFCMIVVAAMTLHVEGGDDKEVGQNESLQTPTKDDLIPKKAPSRSANLGLDNPQYAKIEEKNNAGSTVVLKKQGEFKAKPTENSIQGQWFAPEAHHANPK